MSAVLASSMTMRIAAPAPTRSTSRVSIRRAAAPSALKARKAGVAMGSRRMLVVRAEEDKVAKALETYKSISYKIPPVVSAATLPVVGLSLLCKAITGSGLPGTFLGSIEGVSWLVLFLGAGSLAPRASAILAGGDFSKDAVMEVLTAPSDGSEGKDATARVYNAAVPKNSPLAEQMEDLKKRKAEKEAETPEQKAERERVKAELAAMVLQNAQKNQDSYTKEKGTDDELLAQPATATIGECMTEENFDKPISEYNDDDLNDKLNLSAKDGLEAGAPTVVGKGDDWRMKNFKEAEEREAAAAAAASASAEKAQKASASAQAATDALAAAPAKEEKKPKKKAAKN